MTKAKKLPDLFVAVKDGGPTRQAQRSKAMRKMDEDELLFAFFVAVVWLSALFYAMVTMKGLR